MRTLTPHRSKMVYRNIRLILLVDFLIRKGKSRQDAFYIAATSENLSESSVSRIFNQRYRYHIPKQS
jgi:hypothetical protein